MANFAIIFIPAIFCTLFFRFYWKEDITFKESAISLCLNLGVAMITAILFALYIMAKLSDVEVWNGEVTDKKRVWVSCSHSYEVCTGSGEDRTCVTRYRHSNDWDWRVYTTAGDFIIDRVDSRGSRTPPRWDQVRIGEPASRHHSYRNYLLADPHSLFVESENLAELYILPNYPSVFDYYRFNRVVGTPPKVSPKDINLYLNDRLKFLGPNKQLNIVTVFTNQDPQFFNALMSKWKGGKKNDVIMVFGISEDNISWFRSNSYARGMNNRVMHSRMETLATGQPFTLELLTELVDIVNIDFNRLSADEFSFKQASIQIPLWLLLLVLLLNLGASFGIALYMKENHL